MQKDFISEFADGRKPQISENQVFSIYLWLKIKKKISTRNFERALNYLSNDSLLDFLALLDGEIIEFLYIQILCNGNIAFKLEIPISRQRLDLES